MIRVVAALTCALVTSLPAAAMVGGAQPTTVPDAPSSC